VRPRYDDGVRPPARLWVVLAPLFAVASLAPPAAAAAWRGTSVNPRGYGPQVGLRELDENRNVGANVVRFDIAWADLQPANRDHYDAAYVAQVDDYLQKAADRGLKVIAIVQATPRWAASAPAADCRSPHPTSTLPPTDPGDYAAAAAFVAQRWGAKLAALEVWNEFNNPDFWCSDDWVGDYAGLLKAAYPAIKKVAPGLTVLGGSLLFGHADTLNDLYARGIKGSFDGVSIHPYEDPSRPDAVHTFSTGVPLVRQAMVDHGDGDKPLWLTEFGWPTCAPGDTFAWCVSESRQAAKLTDAFNTAASWPYVDALVIYALRDDATGSANWQSNMGLLHSDFTPKPAWAAFARAIAPPTGVASASAAESAVGTPPTPTPGLAPHPRPRAAPLPALRRWALLGARRLRIWLVCTATKRCRGVVRIARRHGRRVTTIRVLQVSLPPGRRSVRTVSLPAAVAARSIRLLVGL
jgi:hypothetical protein